MQVQQARITINMKKTVSKLLKTNNQTFCSQKKTDTACIEEQS